VLFKDRDRWLLVTLVAIGLSRTRVSAQVPAAPDIREFVDAPSAGSPRCKTRRENAGILKCVVHDIQWKYGRLYSASDPRVISP